MKSGKILAATFILSFLCGLLVFAFMPSNASADEAPSCQAVGGGNPACASWFECPSTYCPDIDYPDYKIIWGGYTVECKKCWIFHGCAVECIPS